jgi:REP element-mobilizing transposase RayT
MPGSKFDPQKHHRHSIRLQEYDYSRPGAYFVTMVTRHREPLFGDVIDGQMKLNKAGEIVQWEWKNIAERFPYIILGAFVVMPNHLHGILIFHQPTVGATHLDINKGASSNTLHPVRTGDDVNPEGSPLPLPRGPKPASLGAVIAQFKSRVTKRLWKLPSRKGTPVWQRNYYEHIIRNENALQNISNYINSNPSRWQEDKDNPLYIQK